ncbi:ATP-binding cassette domain-containing protein [Pseudooceanicola sp. CBS1P-1]|uniref:ATP-binding cassette domain-containing protein n=1 Tax=Pseudooceanicola albus TaxID=2692189 RepID=A0A6L7FXZ5_9RHOB|nr:MULTISPECIES: ATP-binding cassette domain-containing protein [Pseudooceanicola]MBT9383952.1 ATP-binding cassette domain-containing protein [Pseudooceanicola endophyticus]MXN16635.1 ATP-binding cassette domain-containing protein [Pseudooceanicola albus]
MLDLRSLDIRQGSFRLRADFRVAPGAKVAVLGPSGAGKSTLLSVIAGFFPAQGGSVLWQGQPLEGLAPGRRPVAMLFQDGNLFPHLDIARNVALGLTPARRLTPAQRDRVAQALARVGLAGFGPRRPAELSGGQQSRAALARILVQERPLLLLDEPFAALGPALRAEMLDLVAALVEETGATLLMVSHAPEDARRIAGEIVLVEGGTAHPPAPARALLDNPPEALRRYLGD